MYSDFRCGECSKLGGNQFLRLATLVFLLVVCFGTNLVFGNCQDKTLVQDRPASVPETTVGMTGRLDDIKLSGAEVIAKPVEAKDEVVVRIADVQPHGELRRYSIEYWGMEPGVHDLRDYLVRIDDSSTADLPSLPVQIASITVVENGQLTDLTETNIPWVGGYRLWVALGAVAWVAVTICIFTMWRQPRADANGLTAVEKPLTWADKLEPLIQRSQDGDIAAEEQAALERLLVAFWRDKLALNDLPANLALERIKQDPEAGVLLNQLELWLHSPNPDRNVDMKPLLEPYQEVQIT